MKLRNLFACVVASVMALVACQQEVNLGAPSITLSDPEVTLGKEGGDTTITVTATRDWKVKLDEKTAEWLVVDPVSGEASAEAQTVTISALPNEGYGREASVEFTIGMQTRYLTVKQDGEKGSADALVVYANDMNNGKVEKINDRWPYPDQSESWRNEKGSGIANVKYSSSEVTVRSVSSTNNLWFPAKGGSYFSVQDIALNSSTSLELTFDAVHGSPNGYKKVFSTSAFKVFVSKDKVNWVELPYELTVKADNEFDAGSAKFTVEGVENLSVTFQFLGAEDGYRLTNLGLWVYEGTDAAAVDFSNAIAMDFGTGSTPGNNPGTGDLPEGTGEGTLENPYSAAKAINVASTLSSNQTKAGVYVKGIVKEIKEISVEYGNASYYLTDADGAAKFYVFRGRYRDNDKFTSVDQLKVGDEVLVFGDLINYMGNTPELSQGNYIVQLNGDGSGELVAPESKGAKTVVDFLAAADTENYYTLTGEVSSFDPSYCSFDLTDASGSIYVYSVLPQSKSTWASKIANGGTITIYGRYEYYDGNGDETKAKHEVVDAYIVSYTPGEGNTGGDVDTGSGDYDASIVFKDAGYQNEAKVTEVKIDENITAVFAKGAAKNDPTYYDNGEAVRMYQNGSTLDIKAAEGKTITEIKFTFAQDQYYIGCDAGTLSAEAETRVWKGSANAVKFTTTGTDKSHRAYVASIEVAYE